MYLQHIFASSVGTFMSVETTFLAAIVVLACLLGAELAAICILISKAMQARREKQQREFAEEYNEKYHHGDHSDQFAVVALMVSAVPATTQIALLVLAVCTAVAAGVFVVLLMVFRAKGYIFTAKHIADSADATNEGQASAFVAREEDEDARATAVFADEPSETSEEESDGLLQETGTEDEAEAYAEQSAETDETGKTDDGEAESTVTPVTVISRAEPTTGQSAVPNGIPVYSSVYPNGQVPYVEKHITETYKEIVKETNTTTTTTSGGNDATAKERYSPATEEILKAIAELMKISTQLRTEREMAVENPAVKKDESVPAFADADEDEDVDAEEAEEDEASELEETGEQGDGENGSEDGDAYESELFSGNERIVGFDEDTGCYIVAHYRKSFEAKLIQSRPNVKKYYSVLKNALLAYEGTRDRITWAMNHYSNDRVPIAKMNVRTRTLDLYLALDPATLEDSVYHGRDVGDKKKYAETPFLYKVNSPRKLALALELVQRTCEEQGLSPIDLEEVNYEEQYPFDTTENLIARGLIREYLREEKPAVTFELDPDHVPQVPEEDESVIPANANFTWEIDDDRPTDTQTEEVQERSEEADVTESDLNETEKTEEPSECAEPSPAYTTTTTTTSHETMKVTERHYTERYYGTVAQPSRQEQLPANAQPIEAIAEPIAASHECDESGENSQATEEFETMPNEEAAVTTAVPDTEADAPDLEEEPLTWNSLNEQTVDADLSEVGDEDTSEEVYDELPDDEEFVASDGEEASDADLFEEDASVDDSWNEAFIGEETPLDSDEPTKEEDTFSDYDEDVIDESVEETTFDETEDADSKTGDDPESEESLTDEDDGDWQEETAPPSQQTANSNPSVALLDVCDFDRCFEDGAIINLETLKQVGLAPETAVTLKVYASGSLKGRFTVEANHFTLDAIKAIGDADGDSIMIR